MMAQESLIELLHLMGLEHSLDTCSFKIGDGKSSLATLQCWSRGFPITTKLRCRPNWFPVLGNLADKLLNAKFNCSNDVRLSAAPERLLFSRRDLKWFNLASSSGMLPSKSFTDNSNNQGGQNAKKRWENDLVMSTRWFLERISFSRTWSFSSCGGMTPCNQFDERFRKLRLARFSKPSGIDPFYWFAAAEWAAAFNLHRQLSGQKIVTQTHCKPSKACAQTEKPSCELVIGK